jgi:RNA polymerase sigma-70 factor (ECF subfamily)
VSSLEQADARAAVDAVYRRDSRAVLATLIRLLGNFDGAEEALHEAFRAALEKWPYEGIPDTPRAWLVSAGRFRAIDALRRQSRFDPLDTDLHDVAAEARAAYERALALAQQEAERRFLQGRLAELDR